MVSSKGFWRNAWKVDAVEVGRGAGGGGGGVGSATVVSSQDLLRASSSYSSRNTNNKKSSVKLNQQQQHVTDDDDDDEYVAGKKDTQQHVVLKSIKYIHEPNEEIFELSRVDAISLDALTKSQFVINIYGYCGSSSVQEYAGGDLKGLLPVLEPIDKLRMAAWVATGLADIHAVDSSLWNNSNTTANANGDVDSNGDQLLNSSLDDTNDNINGMNVNSNNDNKNIGINQQHIKHSPNNNSTTTTTTTVTSTSAVASLIHNDINMDNILLGTCNTDLFSTCYFTYLVIILPWTSPHGYLI